jgi:methyl-accepting chemotaxis protein
MIPTSLIVFVAVTSLAVVLQMAILFALYLSVRKTTAQVESIAADFQRRSTPIMENARDILADATPKLKEITSNLTEASRSVKTHAETMGNAAAEIAMRAKTQVIRADDIISRTMDRVEKTSDVVHNSVLSPVRHVQGIVQALSIGLSAFMHQKRDRRDDKRRSAADDGMFI